MDTSVSLVTERYWGIDLHKHYLVTGAPWTAAGQAAPHVSPESMPGRRSCCRRVELTSASGPSGPRPT